MKKILLALMLILTTALAFGQESKGILYKATKGEKVIYLFGRIFISENDYLPFSNSVENAFNDSNELILMTDSTTKPSDKAINEDRFIYGYNFEDSSMSKETIELLKKRYNEVNVSSGDFNVYKLWLHFVLINQLQMFKIYTGNFATVDSYFRDNFTKGNISSIFSYEYAMNELIEAKENEIKEMLKYSLEDERKASLIEISAWKNGDEKALRSNIKNYYTKTEKISDEKYNKEVIKYLKSREFKNKIFIVLPVNQLIGNDILFKNFKAEGYKIERVS